MQNAFGECCSCYNDNVFQLIASDHLSTDNSFNSTKESKSLSQVPEQQGSQADAFLAEVRFAAEGTLPTLLVIFIAPIDLDGRLST